MLLPPQVPHIAYQSRGYETFMSITPKLTGEPLFGLKSMPHMSQEPPTGNDLESPRACLEAVLLPGCVPIGWLLIPSEPLVHSCLKRG